MGSLEPSGVTLQTLETSSHIVLYLSKPLSVTPRDRNRTHRILKLMHSILVWVSCHVDFRHGQSRAFVCQHLNPQDKLPSHVMSFEQLSVTP